MIFVMVFNNKNGEKFAIKQRVATGAAGLEIEKAYDAGIERANTREGGPWFFCCLSLYRKTS